METIPIPITVFESIFQRAPSFWESLVMNVAMVFLLFLLLIVFFAKSPGK